MPNLLSLATASPPHRFTQDEALALLQKARGGVVPDRIASVLTNSGVEERQLAISWQDLPDPRSWPGRSEIYAREGLAMAQRATAQALEQAAMVPGDIDAVLFISTTGTMTPSLPSRLLCDMGMRADIPTLPLFGYGCAGGVLGLRVARDLASVGAGQRVLLIAMECCSLAYNHEKVDKKMVVACALFGDGCAAAVIDGREAARGQGLGARIGAVAQRVWPDTLAMMGWDIGETGFDLVLARDLPDFVDRDFAPFADAFLRKQGVDPATLGQPACHPGGARVIEALERYFAAPLPATRRVLAAHGNMSSPTVLFILRDILASGPDKPFAITALGPGFTAAIGLIHPAGST